MNNSKKHRTPGSLGSNHDNIPQQHTRGPLGHDFDIHRVSASTPGPTGHNEGAALDLEDADALRRKLKLRLHHLAKVLREKGVEWAKDTTLDVALDQLKDEGLKVLKKLVGESASAAMLMTDWVKKIVEANQKMSEKWVKVKDPSVKRLEIKGGAPTAAAIEKVQKDGGMVFNGEGGWYWSKDPNYQPNSASTYSVRANPQNKSQPIFDNGNGKRDDRPEHFGTMVFLVATVELAFDKTLDTLIDKGAESHSRMRKWAKKTALQFEKKLVTDEFEKLLTEAAAHKGHHHHPLAPPIPGPSPTKPNAPPGITLHGSTVTPTTNIDQCNSVFNGSSCIKKKGHAPPHQGVIGNTW